MLSLMLAHIMLVLHVFIVLRCFAVLGMMGGFFPLSSLVCLLMHPRNGSGEKANNAILGYQASWLPGLITFAAGLLCAYSACFQEKHSYRVSAFPVSLFLWGCDHFLEKPSKGWGGCGLGSSLAWLSSSGVTATFLFKGGTVEDSGEAGVLLWISGWVECLHYSSGVTGSSPSLR